MTAALTAALRVAARHMMATFIPDKFWREQKAKVKAALTKPLKGSPAVVGFELRETLTPLYERFLKDVEEFGAESIMATVKDRVGNVVHVIQTVSDSHRLFELEMDKSYKWPIHTVKDEVCFQISLAMKSFYEARVKTPADAMKGTWSTVARLIEGQADRLLKKATPEELAALEQTVGTSALGGSYNERLSAIKYGFYDRVNLEGAAAKLIARDKVTYDPIKWFDFLREVLAANYTDPKKFEFRQFDIYGMKIVIDDRSVTEHDVREYVNFFDEAYQKLRTKGFTKVWYGTLFVRCESCGGVNYNTGGGVGANYPIGPDVINVFSRPDWSVPRMVVHELGHRYWFKQMTQSQRSRFESMVKANRRPKPKPGPVTELDPARAVKAKIQINAVAQAAKDATSAFRGIVMRSKRWSDVVEKNLQPLFTAGGQFQNEMLDAVHSAGASATINPQVKALFDAQLDKAGKVRSALFDAGETIKKRLHAIPKRSPSDPPLDDIDKFWSGHLKAIVQEWVKEVHRLIDEVTLAAHVYVEDAVEAYNKDRHESGARVVKEWDDEVAKDDRPVAPVSDYGKSNIDEAFAEAFMHFVCERDMNQDQIESFRAVLKTAAERVVDRVLGRERHRT